MRTPAQAELSLLFFFREKKTGARVQEPDVDGSDGRKRFAAHSKVGEMLLKEVIGEFSGRSDWGNSLEEVIGEFSGNK
jgi:hypothetical protein